MDSKRKIINCIPFWSKEPEHSKTDYVYSTGTAGISKILCMH